MTVKVTFECGGCFAKVEGTRWLQRRFDSLNGKGYGFGVYRTETPEDVAPDGWVAFDPYTGCCYCPACWADIERPYEEEMTHG